MIIRDLIFYLSVFAQIQRFFCIFAAENLPNVHAMAYKPQEDNSESLMRLPEAVFSLEQFINDVFNDKYILVVGSEVVLDKQVHPSGDVNQYILSVINAQLSRNYGDYNDLFSRIGSDIDPIRNLLTSNSFVYDIEDISPELRAVMQTRLFRFVLTTTIDGYVERLMEEVWGPGGFRIVNIGDKTSVDGLRNALVRFGVIKE